MVDWKGYAVETAGITTATEFGSTAHWGPSDDDLSKCVHCGLCLNACPTYRETGLETESPRGRIYLMRAVKEGRLPVDNAFDSHMSLCLVCRACETACPSGVPFGRMMESTRAELWHGPTGPLGRRFAHRLAFEWIFPHIRVFRAMFRGLQFYQRSGLQTVVRRSGLLHRIPGKWGAREAVIPAVESPAFAVQTTVPPRLPGVPRVGFLAGCVMGSAFGDVQRASVRVLERYGCQVIAPEGQGCCGALNVHAGERKHARAMARTVIDSFLNADVDAIVVNSAGCASTMKEYSNVFSENAEYLPRVIAFERKVVDFSEYLAGLPPPDGDLGSDHGEAPTIAVYQDACHLRHAQRVTVQPRSLLKRLGGLRLKEMTNPDLCCGSAGVYNLEHPDMARQVLDEKIQAIKATGASLVVSANPGCILQLRKGIADAGLEIDVKHIAQVLDSAMSSPGSRY